MGLLDSATNAIGATNRVVSGIGQATSNISAVTQSAALIRSSAVNGLTNTGSGVVSQLAGVANTAQGIAAGVQGAIAGAAGLAGAAAGVAGALGATSIAGALGDFAASLGGATSGGAFGGTPSNPLHKYASYTYMFGLYALTDGEVNGGTRSPYAGIPIIQMPSGPTIGATTFMDNVKISGTIGLDQQAGNSNALSISFKVIEPYSMGKFWETLQTAALMAGHKNYVDAPYMLSIIFKGHFNPDEQFQKIPKTDKYIHMKIREVSMRVTARGSEYDIEAYPWNEQGMSSTFSELKTDAMISCNDGGTYLVEDILSKSDKSLKKIINDKLKDDKTRKKNVTYAHEIDIVFPTEPYTSNNMGNPIGLSKLGLDVYNKGDTPMAKDNAAYDAASGTYTRGNIQINTKNANFKFAQGATVQDIINQVILTSDYGKKALEEANQTPEGKVTWWRIETHLHNISDEDPKTGSKARKVIFRVVPYLVDATVFTAPNTGSKGSSSMAISRDYNYIYTGKNHDILDFAIEYKVGFYRAFNADGGKNSEDKTLAQSTGGAADAPSGGAGGAEGQPVGGSGPEKKQNTATGTRTAKHGGGTSFDDAATTAARQFHDLATRGYDMLNLNLKILGDPYFLGDTGHGNFTIPSAGNGINTEGSVDWQTGEVFIKVTFRTPEDANTDTGLYDFAGGTKPVKEFTGIYKVLQVENEFSRGKFTQVLGLTKQTVTEGGGGNFPAKEPAPNDLGDWYG
jgi:hypothetical protein